MSICRIRFCLSTLASAWALSLLSALGSTLAQVPAHGPEAFEVSGRSENAPAVAKWHRALLRRLEEEGQTAVTTIAVNISTSLGVHHCNAAGNDYHDSNPYTSHLIAPADAFQGITCGAVDSSGYIASFSSDGPTADGRVKPELLARGVSTYTVSRYSDTECTTASGTSLSTPLVACAVACLIDARSHWTVDQVRENLFYTADYYVANGTYDPLYIRGYGILDGDWDVDLSDLAILLSNYGMTEGAMYTDGDVDLTDLAALLAVYGTTCG